MAMHGYSVADPLTTVPMHAADAYAEADGNGGATPAALSGQHPPVGHLTAHHYALRPSAYSSGDGEELTVHENLQLPAVDHVLQPSDYSYGDVRGDGSNPTAPNSDADGGDYSESPSRTADAPRPQDLATVDEQLLEARGSTGENCSEWRGRLEEESRDRVVPTRDCSFREAAATIAGGAVAAIAFSAVMSCVLPCIAGGAIVYGIMSRAQENEKVVLPPSGVPDDAAAAAEAAAGRPRYCGCALANPVHPVCSCIVPCMHACMRMCIMLPAA